MEMTGLWISELLLVITIKCNINTCYLVAENKVLPIILQTVFCQLHTELASSGLWENVKPKKNTIPTYHTWHQLCMVYTGVNGGNGGELATPGGKTILTNLMKIVCAPFMWLKEGSADPFRWVVAPSYLRWSDLGSYRTSSQMWGSWYFSRFLVRDGSYTKMNITFFMVLVMPWATLSTMVKQSTSTGCPVVWLWW